MKKLRIGLFGFGVVGEGIFQVLSQKPQLECEIVKICIKDPDKLRNAPDHFFTTNPQDILKDDSINVVVELIDDPDSAFEIVSTALKSGKSVVSANKKMIAENHLKLIELQQKHQTSFLYEAAVCGSIPILRNLEEYFDNDLLQYVSGIVNGSTNYILTQMAQNGGSYDESLKSAQELGFAETDPSLDVEGQDAAFKLSIICLHAFGKIIESKSILRKGICSIDQTDLSFAKANNLKLKLVASTHQNGTGLDATVFPTFIENGHTLSSVDNEYNGLLIGSSLADEQFFYGKGAGRFPTSSAVLSDISALKYDYKYEMRKGLEPDKTQRNVSKKFYVSFKNGVEVNKYIFDSIDGQYQCEDQVCIIGHISLNSLKQESFWKNPDVSIIAFHG